jgi:DNA-binding CsgD family transcriptional regulator
MQSIQMLTLRERNLMLLLMQGKVCKQICAELHISENIVKQHIKNIYQKLGVNSRSEAVMWLLKELYPELINVENIKKEMEKRLFKKVA